MVLPDSCLTPNWTSQPVVCRPPFLHTPSHHNLPTSSALVLPVCSQQLPPSSIPLPPYPFTSYLVLQHHPCSASPTLLQPPAVIGSPLQHPVFQTAASCSPGATPDQSKNQPAAPSASSSLSKQLPQQAAHPATVLELYDLAPPTLDPGSRPRQKTKAD